MKATHKVQSHRGVIERMFAHLKKWQILQNGTIEEIEKLEKVMDVAMALHNLNLRDRDGLMEGIPAQKPRSIRGHIITKDGEPDFKIPQAMSANNTKFPSQWQTFKERMTVITPGLDLVLKKEGNDAIFSVRVIQRGKNLFQGGNVAQIQCQMRPQDVIRVKAVVHASMKSASYECFFELQKGDILIRQACMCKSG